MKPRRTERAERPSLSTLTERRPPPAVGLSPSPAKKPEEKRRPLTSYEIEKNLKESLASTDEGLKKFLASLRQAGMSEAVQGYRAMTMVLIQQRLWADEHRRESLIPLFRSIARSADDIHRIFSSFADVMRPLKEVDKIQAQAMKEGE